MSDIANDRKKIEADNRRGLTRDCLQNTKYDSDSPEKRNRPFAELLPSKYKNVDVTKMFPKFRKDKTLRFLGLFGSTKENRSKVWRNVQKRRKSNESDNHYSKKRWELNFATLPSADQIATDGEEKVHGEHDTDKDLSESHNRNKPVLKSKIADWRYGPAQYWYDMLDVPESGEGFDYGFQLKDADNPDMVGEPPDPVKGVPEDAFLMVSQVHWEDDVIWDVNDIKNEKKKMHIDNWNAIRKNGATAVEKLNQSGSDDNFTLSSTKNTSNILQGNSIHLDRYNVPLVKKSEEMVDKTWYSIFPVENEELVYGKWEDEVIWDAKAMTNIPQPKICTLDRNDENIIFEIPPDVNPSKEIIPVSRSSRVKNKSKILLEEVITKSDISRKSQNRRDPFNISNDEYYMPRTVATISEQGNAIIASHSTPLMELRSPFIQTFMTDMQLRNFHRPQMKRFSNGYLAEVGAHSVSPLLQHIRKKGELREVERINSGGGDVFFMRTPEDLTGKDGDLILIEFSEEYPPLMNQVGMCSKIKNYYKRIASKDKCPKEFRYGEIAYVDKSPFLGTLSPGCSLQVVENNMYRAPIYEHETPKTDFLVIRTREGYYIRDINAMFTVGQEIPLFEVPAPKSKKVTNFVKHLMKVFIYRLFWKSTDNPKRIRIDDLRKCFPFHSENIIRRRLQDCSVFQRTGVNNWWVLKPEFRLPSEEELTSIISAEQCCAYYSMLSAQLRLKDAGYGEKCIFASSENEDEENQLKIEDEIKTAPWNTTRAYLQSMKGKCLLQLTGPADPTGCGEGFSYVRVSTKPQYVPKEQQEQCRRVLKGSDADLRSVRLNDAKQHLRDYGISDSEINQMSRWEVIDNLRTLSSRRAIAGEEGEQVTKFSRANINSGAAYLGRYKKECQRIFDLQNRLLSNNEVLSTDEYDSDNPEDNDLEEMGKHLEELLTCKESKIRSNIQTELNQEENQRLELMRLMMDGNNHNKIDNKNQMQHDVAIPNNHKKDRVLKISRTYTDDKGRNYTRIETIRDPQVIDGYIKLKTTKDDVFIKQFTESDADKANERREKRRKQEQLKRLQRKQEYLPNVRELKRQPDTKLKCSACGMVGHIRSNKLCRMNTIEEQYNAKVVQHLNGKKEESNSEAKLSHENLVYVEPTKINIKTKAVKHIEPPGRHNLVNKTEQTVRNKQKYSGAGNDGNHFKKYNRNTPVNRRRTDPLGEMSSILKKILLEIKDLPNVHHFLLPVNIKSNPLVRRFDADYYKVLRKPMDLQTIEFKLRLRSYLNRTDFLTDVNQIVVFSEVYNGKNSSITHAAKKMLQICANKVSLVEDRLMVLERKINTTSNDNDQVTDKGLSSFLNSFLNLQLKTMPFSFPFLKPVNKKQEKLYNTIICRPMDLETMTRKVTADKYHSREEFIDDIELIANNCVTYNGPHSKFAAHAREMVNFTKEKMKWLKNASQLELTALGKKVPSNLPHVNGNCSDKENYSIAEPNFKTSHPHTAVRTDDIFDNSLFEDNRKRSGTGTLPKSETHINQKKGGTILIDAAPHFERGRGRPRKHKIAVEEESGPKRKRGRPLKNDFQSLENDLQYSTDDDAECDDFVKSDSKIDESVIPSIPVAFPTVSGTNHDSKQKDDSVFQLDTGYHTNKYERFDSGPNYDDYDPFDFTASYDMPEFAEPQPQPGTSLSAMMPQEKDKNMDVDGTEKEGNGTPPSNQGNCSLQKLRNCSFR